MKMVTSNHPLYRKMGIIYHGSTLKHSMSRTRGKQLGCLCFLSSSTSISSIKCSSKHLCIIILKTKNKHLHTYYQHTHLPICIHICIYTYYWHVHTCINHSCTYITRRSVEHCTPHADGAWLNELGWSQ